MLEHNKVLMAENQLIKAKLTVTEELLEELRTNQQARISALADQLQQQVLSSEYWLHIYVHMHARSTH